MLSTKEGSAVVRGDSALGTKVSSHITRTPNSRIRTGPWTSVLCLQK